MRTIKYTRTFEQMGLTDGDPDNAYRASRALYALGAYCAIDGQDRTEEPLDGYDVAEAIRDLIGDLAHLYQSVVPTAEGEEPGDAFSAEIEQALEVYYEEVSEEADDLLSFETDEEPEPDPDEEYDRLKADGELESVMRGRGL